VERCVGSSPSTTALPQMRAQKSKKIKHKKSFLTHAPSSFLTATASFPKSQMRQFEQQHKETYKTLIQTKKTTTSENKN
jgi:hypothetical protein